jgi:hypothetical protein
MASIRCLAVVVVIGLSLSAVALAVGPRLISGWNAPSSTPAPVGVVPATSKPPPLRSNVVVLTNATSKLLISHTGALYVFPNNATQIASVVAGDVVISELPPGYLIWVSSVSAVGSYYYLYGNATALSNAFGKGTLDGTTYLSPSSNLSTAVTPASTPTFKFGLGKTWISGGVSISVTGSASATIQPTIDLNFSWTGLSSAFFSVNFTQTVQATLSVSGAVAFGAEVTVWSQDLGCIWIWIVCVVPQIDINVGVSISTAWAYTTSVTLTLSETLDIADNGGSWSAWSHSSRSATYSNSPMQTANVRLYADTPEIAFLIYGIAGPFFTVEPGVQFTASANSWNLDADLNLNAGVTTNPGLGVSAELSWTLLTLSWILASGQFGEVLTLTFDGSTANPTVTNNSLHNFVASGGVSGNSVEILYSSAANPQTPGMFACSTCSGSFSSLGTFSASDTLHTGSSSFTFYIGAVDEVTAAWSNWIRVTIEPTVKVTVDGSSGPLVVANNSLNSYVASGNPGDGVKVVYAPGPSPSGAFTCATCVGSFGSTGQFTASDTLYTGSTAFTFYVGEEDTTVGIWGNWVTVTIEPTIRVTVDGTTGPLTVVNNSKNTYVATGNPGDGVKIVYAPGPSPSGAFTCSTCVGTYGSTGKFTASDTLYTGATAFTFYVGVEDTTAGLWGNWVKVTIFPSLHLSVDGHGGSITVSNNSVNTYVVSGSPGDGVKIVYSTSPTPPGSFSCGTCIGTFGSNGEFTTSDKLYTGSSSFTFYIAAEDTTTGLWSNWVTVTILPG